MGCTSFQEIKGAAIAITLCKSMTEAELKLLENQKGVIFNDYPYSTSIIIFDTDDNYNF
jgi:hypothetical protein